MNKKNINSDKNVCFYFDNGYCKYKNSCRFIHPEIECNNRKCLRKYCEKRHPKVCRFFKNQHGCKFQDRCSFKHIEYDSGCYICENLKVIIAKDKDHLDTLMKINQEKDSELENLKVQIETLKNENVTLEKKVTDKNSEEKKIKDLICQVDKSGMELKDTRIKAAHLRAQNQSIEKENAILKEKAGKYIDDTKIKDMNIANLRKEIDSLNVTLKNHDGQIKVKDSKNLDLEKVNKFSNVTLA